jgi:hypothetical protein
MKRIMLIILWIYVAMMAAQMVFNIGDLMLDHVGLPQAVVRVTRDCRPVLFCAAPIVALILAAHGILPGTQEGINRTSGRFWFYVGVTSAVIHSIFCMQLFPFQGGGRVVSEGTGEAGLLFFYPQYILVYCLPPEYWIIDDGNGLEHINFFHFWGKMLVAFPASLVYALFFAELTVILNNLRKKA